MSCKTVHSASCFRVNVIEFLVNSNDYGSEGHGERILGGRLAGSLATAFHRYISFPGPVNKAVSRERVSVTSWAPFAYLDHSFQRLPRFLPLKIFFFLTSFSSTFIPLPSFSITLSLAYYRERDIPFLLLRLLARRLDGSFFSARIIRSFSPLMSGNYGVSTANDQWRSMIPLAEGEHALRVNRRSFVRQQQNKGEKERV